MDELIPYAGDQLARISAWTQLPPDERKRRAVAACRDRDADVLIDLCESHLALHGKKGSRVSQNTRDAYRIAIRALLKAWAGVNLLHPSPDEAALMVRRWEASGLSPSTITVRLAGARALYRALRWAGAVSSDPLADTRTPPDPTPAWSKRQPYSDDDVERLLNAAEGEDVLLILLAAHAALRVNELLALTWAVVDISQGCLTVVRGKGGKSRRVTLSHRLSEALQAAPRSGFYVISGYRSDEQARNRIKRLCALTNTKYRGCHSFRHWSGTKLYRQTGKLEDAQHHLGHQDISTTLIYAKWSDDALKNNIANW